MIMLVFSADDFAGELPRYDTISMQGRKTKEGSIPKYQWEG